MRDSLVARVRGLLAQPKQELPKTIAEPGDVKSLLPYVLVLISIGALSRFVSEGIIGTYIPPMNLFGMKTGGGWLRMPIGSLVRTIVGVGVEVGAWWLCGYVLNALAPSFGARKDESAANKVAAWTGTPIWLAGALAIFGSIPYLGWVAGLGLLGGVVYGVVVGMWALPVLMGTPETKAPGHILAAMGITLAATALVVFVVFGLILGPIFPTGPALIH